MCHELPVGKKIIKRVLKNVIKRAFGELNNIFQDEFNKMLSRQSSNARLFYHITERSKLDVKKNKGPKHTHLAMTS